MTPSLREIESGEEVKKSTPPDAMAGPEITTSRQTPGPVLPAWLTAKTGPGQPAEYLDHVGNPLRSPGLARMLRGLTGLLGELDFAVVDIALGLLAFLKERSAGASGQLAPGTGA